MGSRCAHFLSGCSFSASCAERSGESVELAETVQSSVIGQVSGGGAWALMLGVVSGKLGEGGRGRRNDSKHQIRFDGMLLLLCERACVCFGWSYDVYVPMMCYRPGVGAGGGPARGELECSDI